MQRTDCVHACSYHELHQVDTRNYCHIFSLVFYASSLPSHFFRHSFSSKHPREGSSKNIINYGNGEVELSVGIVMRKEISLVFSVNIQIFHPIIILPSAHQWRVYGNLSVPYLNADIVKIYPA